MASSALQGNNSKLLGLEVLRFISAMAVLFWHYQHFSFVADKAVDFAQNQQPLYGVFALFYNYGFYGVQVFWCISGFIFFWKYRTALADGAIGARKFFVLRFSRLYPLHFVTMVLVGLLQLVYFAQRGYYFVYQHNDLKHLILNLFLASHWGLQDGYSFNAPIWSISVEVLVYLIFFLTLRSVGRSAWVNGAVLLICAAAKWAGATSPVVDAAAYFYAGGLAAIAFRYLEGSKYLAHAKLVMLAFVALTPVAAYAGNYSREQFIPLFLLAYLPVLLFVAARDFPMPTKIQRLVEAAGNMTYSSYLVHFPIQLSLAIFCDWLNRPIPYYSVKFFGMFMGLTLVAAYFVYRWFELPAQDAIRRKFA
ncbi:acyltransferase family protein [Pseudoduganella sp. RAF19]|uniref:acyltransferase family protein n=1 Tax=Pseudoduganella sp. RAF19 TaxID=3233052 RepID=UPI003F9B1265